MSAPRNRRIGIIDYGVGNLHSLAKALRLFAAEVVFAQDPGTIGGLDGLVLPGVGAFKAGMDGLKERGLVKAVKNFALSGKPVLGICLGAQLLFSKGYEFGVFRGLDLIEGKVVKLSGVRKGTKIPHIGWNTVTYQGKHGTPYMYFVHSYILMPRDTRQIVATTTYGGVTFCSVVEQDHITGCQFHPEKSGIAGLRVIKNFVNRIP